LSRPKPTRVAVPIEEEVTDCIINEGKKFHERKCLKCGGEGTL